MCNAENFKNQDINTNKTNDISYKAFEHCFIPFKVLQYLLTHSIHDEPE